MGPAVRVKPELARFSDLESLSRAAAEIVVGAARQAVAERGRFALALSGGKTPRRLFELLAGSAIDWSRAHLFWGDERCLPRTDPASNYRMAAEALLSKAAVPPQNVHAPSVEIGSPEAAAKSYEEELRGFFRDAPAAFDVTLLGMGPDGHTASLFPGSAALLESKRWVLAVDGKQGDPPVPRVTLTLPALNASRVALFLVSGARKRPLIDEIMRGGAPYPAATIEAREKLLWYFAEND